MAQLPFFELTIDEHDNETRVQANALVDVPAHMKNFVAFSKEQLAYKFTDDEKRMVTGVMISANTPIYRQANHLVEEPHNIVFKANTIESIRKKFMLESRGSEVNEMHDEHRFVEGVKIVDSYIIGGDKNPKAPEVFKDLNLQDGTWIASYHIENDVVWAKVKSGEFNGFSVEGIFNYSVEPLSIKKDGEEFAIDQQEIKVGAKLTTSWTDEAGGNHVQPINKGSYSLQDGRTITVKASGEVEHISKAKQKKMKNKKKGFKLLGFTFGGVTVEMVDVTAVDGTVLSYEGELAVGTAVFITDESEEQLPAPAGEYAIELEGTNWLVTIDENGMVSALEEVEAAEGEEMDDEDFNAENFTAFMEQYDAKQQEKFQELGSKLAAAEETIAAQKKTIAHMQTAMNSKFNYTPKKTDAKGSVTYKELLNNK
jgi:Putative phage serine protease XkdF